MKKIIIIAGIALAVLVLAGGAGLYLGYRNFMKVVKVQSDPQLAIYYGGGGNSVVLTSEDGTQALIIDTKLAGGARQIARDVQGKQTIIVNTHCHPDHVGGNSLFPSTTIIAGAYDSCQWKAGSNNCCYPGKTIPCNQESTFYIGSETVHVRNMGRGHTWDDLVVYLEKRKMLITGDLLFGQRHPVLAAKGGTNVKAWNGLLDSLRSRYDIAVLVPGHGALSDRFALDSQQEYFNQITNAASDPSRLSELEEKYKRYSGIPGMAGFHRTVEFIEKEQAH